MTNEMIEMLEKKGWTKGNMDRLYINAAQLGLVCTYYNTGNIRTATFCGEAISNCHARKMKAAKTFIDIKSDTVYSDDATLAHTSADMTGIEYEARSWDNVIKLNKTEEDA